MSASRIIDTLIWERLGSFWSERYSTSDKAALSAVYEAAAKVLEAEVVRGVEIDKAKSLSTCPVYTQRRWLRLDLNRYEELRAWLKFLAGTGTGTGSGTGTGALSTSTDGSAGATANLCTDGEAHPRHWHLRFPWNSRSQGSTIVLGYPISPELVEIWGSDGRLATIGTDYSIAVGGKAIQITTQDTYDISVALNMSSSTYANTSWSCIRASGFVSAGVVPVPDGFGQSAPIHAAIIRNPPVGTTAEFFTSNNGAYSTEVIFHPSVAQTAGGAVVPGAVPGDIVLLFGLVRSTGISASHVHQRISAVIPSTTATSWVPLVAPGAAVLYGTPGIFSHQIRVYQDGIIIPPAKYSYDRESNTFFFNPPLVNAGGTINLDLEWTEESNGGQSHRHYSCDSAIVTTTEDPSFFDDGGTFDDGGLFDSVMSTAVATFPFVVDIPSSELYANGILLEQGNHYTASVRGTSTVVSFATGVGSANLLLRFRAESQAYAYGGLDLPATLPAAAAQNLASDLANVSAAFYAQFSSSLRNISALVEAANVLAAGGNPLLTLFADEWAEYSGLPVDISGAAVDSATARAVESSQTSLVSIPFLQDHVYNPTVRLTEGVDYTIVNGAVQSSNSLVEPRGADDKTPGVWWCPLVILDERVLAKNFGALVDDEQASSDVYRGILSANLRLRFSGATTASVKSAVAAYSGSAVVADDCTVLGKYTVTQAKLLTITAQSGAQQTVRVAADNELTVGSPVAAGQPLSQPLSFYGVLPPGTTFSGHELVITPPIASLSAGQHVRLALSDGYGSFTILSIATKPTLYGVEQHVQFTGSTDKELSAAPVLVAYTTGPGPFAAFDGTVTGVVPQTKTFVRTTAGDYPSMTADTPDPGTKLSRGEAIESSAVKLHSEAEKRNWYIQTPADVVALSHLRSVSVFPAHPYGRATIVPAFPELRRGTKITLGDTVYTVLGSSNGIASVSPSLAGSGVAAITPPVDPELSLFEFAASGESPIITNIAGGPSTVTVFDASLFPARGRAAAVDDLGHRAVFSYRSVDGNQLLGVVWADRIPAMTNPVAKILSELKESRVHPAFTALAAVRAPSVSSLAIGDAKTQLLYDLVKNNAVVVEANNPKRPTALRELLDDVMPAHSGAVLYSVHKTVDLMRITPSDSGVASPIFNIQLTLNDAPTSATTSVSVVATPVIPATANAAAITDAWSTASFGWSVVVTGGPATTLTISHPLQTSTQINGLQQGGTYNVMFKAVTSAGLVRTQSLALVIPS